MQFSFFKKYRNSTLIKDSAIYAFGAFFQKGIAYFLIPLYFGVLLPTEYGELNIFTTLISILSIFSSCGLAQVYYSEFYHYQGEGKKELVRNIITSYIIFALPVFFIFFILFIIFGETLLHFKTSLLITTLVFLISFLMFFQSIFFASLRLSGKSIKFITINISTGILFLVTNIILVYYLRIGILGIFISNFIVAFIIAFVAGFNYYKIIGKFHFHLNETTKYYLKLGFPFIFSSLSYWLVNYANIWIINQMLSQKDVGIYTAAYKFAQIYDPLIIAPLLSAFTPYLFKRLSEKNYNTKFRLYIPVILMLFGMLIFISLFFAKLSTKLAATENYNASFTLIPCLVMSFGFIFIAQMTGGVLIFYKKTRQLTINIAISGVINILLTVLLVHFYRLQGSAIANVISNAIWAFLTLYQSKLQITRVIKDQQ